MRDLAPWPGIEPRPPALGAQGLNRWTTREAPKTYFKYEHIEYLKSVTTVGQVQCIHYYLQMEKESKDTSVILES